MSTSVSQNPNYWGPILSTHPLGYRQLIVRSLRLYFASFSRVIMLSFLLSILVFLPRLVSYVVARDIFADIGQFTPTIIWWAALNIGALLLVIAIFWHIHCVAHYKQEGFNQDFKVGLHKVLYVFLATIIESLIILVAISITTFLQVLLVKYKILSPAAPAFSWSVILTIAVFLLQFALILYSTTVFLFLIPLIAIENEHIFTSLKRSFSLTWNHWWLVFSTQISPWIYFVIFLMCIKFLIGVDVHLYFLDHNSFSLAPILLQILLFTLFIIWPACLLYVQLKDLELRKKAAIRD